MTGEDRSGIRFYIESLGCPKNQVDSEDMIAELVASNYVQSYDPEEADFIIVNTCGFIEDAKKESIQTALQFKEAFPEKKIIMAGCLSARYGEILHSQMSEIDAFIGTSGPKEIAAVMAGFYAGSKNGLHAAKDTPGRGGELRRSFLSFPGSAYVKISEGCDNACSYCAIPLIRGPLRSRGIESIVREIEHLVGLGIIEINLVAQDCGSFGKDTGNGLPRLLEAISRLQGRFWVRIMYMHPDHFPFDILKTINRDERFLPYFDLPFQHASERILSAMGRKGSDKIYLDLLERIRESRSDAVIRSTFLVGFPGETEDDIRILEEFQEKALLDWAGVFRYSREEGTRAYSFERGVGAREAERRKKRIEEKQLVITKTRLERFVGLATEVLIEEEILGGDCFLGRGFMHAPEIDGLVVAHGKGMEPGKLATVRLLRRNGVDLEGAPDLASVACTTDNADNGRLAFKNAGKPT